jgi:hypothetical protein
MTQQGNGEVFQTEPLPLRRQFGQVASFDPIDARSRLSFPTGRFAAILSLTRGLKILDLTLLDLIPLGLMILAG